MNDMRGNLQNTITVLLRMEHLEVVQEGDKTPL